MIAIIVRSEDGNLLVAERNQNLLVVCLKHGKSAEARTLSEIARLSTGIECDLLWESAPGEYQIAIFTADIASDPFPVDVDWRAFDQERLSRAICDATANNLLAAAYGNDVARAVEFVPWLRPHWLQKVSERIASYLNGAPVISSYKIRSNSATLRVGIGSQILEVDAYLPQDAFRSAPPIDRYFSFLKYPTVVEWDDLHCRLQEAPRASKCVPSDRAGEILSTIGRVQRWAVVPPRGGSEAAAKKYSWRRPRVARFDSLICRAETALSPIPIAAVPFDAALSLHGCFVERDGIRLNNWGIPDMVHPLESIQPFMGVSASLHSVLAAFEPTLLSFDPTVVRKGIFAAGIIAAARAAERLSIVSPELSSVEGGIMDSSYLYAERLRRRIE